MGLLGLTGAHGWHKFLEMNLATIPGVSRRSALTLNLPGIPKVANTFVLLFMTKESRLVRHMRQSSTVDFVFHLSSSLEVSMPVTSLAVCLEAMGK